LSTNTKNAHIPLVNQSNKVIHPVPKDIDLVISDNFNFSPKYWIDSLINANPKNNTNGPDKKFILTAIVSGDNQAHPNIEPILNQNAINECRKKGITLPAHIFHHNIPKFSAITLGVYKYS
jgi:hypothetical protein